QPDLAVAHRHGHLVLPRRADDVGVAVCVRRPQVALGTAGQADAKAEGQPGLALLVDVNAAVWLAQLQQPGRVQSARAAAEDGGRSQVHAYSLWKRQLTEPP